MKKRLVFGMGYLGRRVAEAWLAQGDQVGVVSRSKKRADELAEQGFEGFVQDLSQPWALPKQWSWDTVLIAVGYDRTSQVPMKDVYVGGVAKILRNVECRHSTIYISTTGVYGDADGELVSESSTCRPLREGGICSLEAESLLQDSLAGNQLKILRSAGIYGPGRLPNLKALQNSQPLKTHPDHWLNLIHVEDLKTVALWAAEETTKHQIYNVSDGCPVLRRDYYGYLGELGGVEEIRFEPAEQGDGNSRASLSKRVCSDRLRQEFTEPLAFPSFRQGLAAAFSSSLGEKRSDDD